jgi:hypothetical protein
MRLRESGTMTAEEVRERRELRLRSMSALIPGVDRDLMGADADRTLEIMVAEGHLPDAPQSVAGIDVDWDYAGPLARAQQRQQGEAMTRLFEATMIAAKIDPTAPMVLDVAEGLRAIAEAEGAPVGLLRSREDYAERVAAQMERQDTAESLQATQAAATAVRDGGQGIANLVAANNGGQLQAA